MSHEENTVWCRFCEQLQFNLWNRQFCLDDTDGAETDEPCPSKEL